MSSTRITTLVIIVSVVLLLGSFYLSRSCSQLLAQPSQTVTTSSSSNENRAKAALTKAAIAASRVYDNRRDAAFYESIRSKKKYANGYLPPVAGSCPFPPGNSQCLPGRRATTRPTNATTSNNKTIVVDATSNSTSRGRRNKRSSSGCCCCCWYPHSRSCVGTFSNATESWLRGSILQTRFFARFGANSLQEAANRACPWWDRGFWSRPLPSNFLELDEHKAARAVAVSCGSGCPGATTEPMWPDEFPEHTRRQTGPMLVWELGRKMHKLRPQVNASWDRNRAPGGVLMFSGDSMTRQVFSRMVHNVRSRECSDEAEMRRNAVFEMQIHETAAYVVTTHGDAFTLSKTCEEGITFLTHSSLALQLSYSKAFVSRSGGNSNNISTTTSSPQDESAAAAPRVLLQACFAWDNTPNALMGTVHNLNVLMHFATYQVAALVFFPNIWYCGMKEPHIHVKCMDANQSNGAALAVAGMAVHYSIPRVVITTNVYRQHFWWFNVTRVRQRNEQLRLLFPHKLSHYVSSMTSPESKSGNEGAGAAAFLPASPSVWSNVRLFDFGRVHDALAPEQCDVVHGMCMFLPARSRSERVAQVKSLFGGTQCPGPNGTCQDLGNFILLRELLKAIDL